jgi:type I restriction enzyme S subunit
VHEIAHDAWVLELEDIEKDSGRVLHQLTKNDRKISGIRHKFQKGQVLYSKLRTYLNKVLIAQKDGFCTTEIIPITPINGKHPINDVY